MVTPLNERLQWVYTVYLMGGIVRDARGGVLVDRFYIDDEDVTSAVIRLTRRGLIDKSKLRKPWKTFTSIKYEE